MMVLAQGLASAAVPANVNTASSVPRAPFSFASAGQSSADQSTPADCTVAAGPQQNAPDVLPQDSGGLSARTRLFANPRPPVAPPTSRLAAPSKFAVALAISVHAAACSDQNAPSRMLEPPTTPDASGSVNEKDPAAGPANSAQQSAGAPAPLPRESGVSALAGSSVAQIVGGTIAPGAPVPPSAAMLIPIVPVTPGDVPLLPKVEVSFGLPTQPQVMAMSSQAETAVRSDSGNALPAEGAAAWQSATGLRVFSTEPQPIPEVAVDAGQKAGAPSTPQNAPDPTQGVVPAEAPTVNAGVQQSVVHVPTVVPAIAAAPEAAQDPASDASPAPAEERHSALPAANSAGLPSGQLASLLADLPAMMNVPGAVRLRVPPTDQSPAPPNAATKNPSFRPADPASNAPSDPAGSVAQKDALQPSAAAPLSASSLFPGARTVASAAPPAASGIAREVGCSSSGTQQESSESREQKPGAVGGISAARSSPASPDADNASVRAAGEPGWAGAVRSELRDPSAAASHPHGTAATEEMCSTAVQGNSGSSSLSAGEAAPGAPSPVAPAAANAAPIPSTAVPAPVARASDTNDQPSPAVSVKADAAGSESWKSGEVSTRPDTTELRVSFQTDGLGPIELRASLHQNSVAASIAVSRGDVQAALSGDLSAVHQAMAQHDLRLESLKVIHSPLGNHSGFSAGSHSPRGNPNRHLASPQRGALSDSSAGEFAQPAASRLESSGAAGHHGRLSVHV